jgi:hypothetical protein
MNRYQLIDGAVYVRADQACVGDALDLEGDKFADPDATGMNPSQTFDYTFEFASVEGTERETPGCIRIDTDQGSIGFPPDHLIKTQPVLYACGICDQYHPNGFHGDCRDDSNRIADPDELYGPTNWTEIAMEDAN